MTKNDSVATGLPRTAAIAIVCGVLGTCALVGRRNAPAPSHPATRRWYKRLDKPDFTPPDLVFGAAWPLLETGLAIGGYRLLRQPATATRNVAVGLWLINNALIAGWTELFFRRKALGASVALSGAMVASSGAYVITGGRTDRAASTVGIPLVAWLGFATVLAGNIWLRGRRVRPES